MEYIKEIELVFENCESMVVPRNVIGQFDIEDIHVHIHRIASNAIAKYQVPNKIALEIFSEYNAEYQPFDMDIESWKDYRFNRITSCNDITPIGVIYEDGSHDIFYTDFDGECVNANQKSVVSTLGNLYIVIGKDMAIGDVFPDDYMDDEEEVKLRKDMFDIGIEEELPPSVCRG